MSTAAQTLTSGDVRDRLHAVQAAQDALDGMKAALLAELDACCAPAAITSCTEADSTFQVTP